MDMTNQNAYLWKSMVKNGMRLEHAFDRMTDWARMLETRLSELDPNYRAYPWGLNFRASMTQPESMTQQTDATPRENN